MDLSKDNLPPRPDEEMNFFLEKLFGPIDSVNTALIVLGTMSEPSFVQPLSNHFWGGSVDKIDESIRKRVESRPLTFRFREDSPFHEFIVWEDEANKVPFRLDYEEMDRLIGGRTIAILTDNYGTVGVRKVSQYLEAVMGGTTDDPALTLLLKQLYDETVIYKSAQLSRSSSQDISLPPQGLDE